MPRTSRTPFSPASASPSPLQVATATGKVGLWDWDIVTNEVKWTDAVFTIHGVEKGNFEVTFENFMALVFPEDLPRLQAALKEALENHAPYELEFRIRRPDGQVAWIFTNGTVLRQDGRPIRMIGATLDVSATRHANEASLRLAAIVESSDDAILSKDLNSTIITWNRGAENLFGYTAAEVIGRSVTILIPEERQNEEPSILDRIRRGERIEHYETVRQRKNGTRIHVSLTVSPIKDAGGKVVGASKIARNITAQKLSEEALRFSEERFRLLASHAPVGIFLTDQHGNCIFVNERWCRMSGLEPAQAQGAGWASALHPEDRDRVLGGWSQAVKGGRPSDSEFRFVQPSGRVVWIQGSAVQFHDGERFQGYLGSCIDITERKEVELQTQFLHELGDGIARLTDPDKILEFAQAGLGAHLRADRCYFYEMLPHENLAIIREDWRMPGLRPTQGRHNLRDFGTVEFVEMLMLPRSMVADLKTHPVTRGSMTSFEALDMASLATATLSNEGGRRILSLAVSTRHPRVWTTSEMDLIENVMARIWPAVERARADRALRESEQLYRGIGDAISYGVWVCNADGRNVYASDAFLRLLGITQAQWSARGWSGLLHPDEVEATAQAWSNCIREGKTWEREHRFKGADGRWHPILARGVPVRGEDGKILRWVGINLDIAGIKQAEASAKNRMETLEKLNVVGGKLVSEHELEKIVQTVTDVGREVSGAGFGAFFYNVANAEGESYTLYTLSGAERSAFDHFPMPRATALFGSTFRGEGIVRIDDVLEDPRYGRNAPYQGMPAGHLPIRSYLAVPVTSRSGAVIGGLFFGHAEPGRFTAEAETSVATLAAQAAIAIDNAKLYAALQKELEEQRRTEIKLRESENRWRQLAEAMPQLVWTCRPDGYCDFLSPQWVAYTGAPEAGQLGSGWVEFVHPEDRAALAEKWQLALDTGEVFDTEFRIRRADGKYRAFKTRAIPVRDGEDRIVKWYGTNTDIEEFRRIEQAIRKSENQLRLIADHAPVFLVQTDLEHRFKFVNRSYADRYGRRREDIVGRHVSELTGAEAFATFKVHMDNTLTGRRVEFEQEIPYATLGKRWVHVIYEPERAPEGHVIGLVAVVVDITLRKQSEFDLARARDEALAASRAKDEFLAALSHELRTPLSPVLLIASDSANNPALPREIRENFETIRTNVSLEARLIDDLLDLTRITRGKMPLEKSLLDIHDILRDAVANIRPEIEAKHMELTLNLHAQHSTILGDPVRLQQVAWNILKNAVKFTPSGGKIAIETESASDPDRITIEFSDTGMGMSPSELARIFEAFTQGEHAAGSGSHRFGGLGLGLAISQKLVELHDGRIYASSAGRNRGSIFVIMLPVTIPNSIGEKPAVPAAATPAKLAPLTTGSILLVEDHPSTRETLQKLLTRRNYDVVAAGSAADARQAMASRRFDFLVSDVGLPDSDGYQLMRELRIMQPSLQGIAISGYGMEDDLQRSQAAGFATHLVKPVGITALERALAALPRSAPV